MLRIEKIIARGHVQQTLYQKTHLKNVLLYFFAPLGPGQCRTTGRGAILGEFREMSFRLHVRLEGFCEGTFRISRRDVVIPSILDTTPQEV